MAQITPPAGTTWIVTTNLSKTGPVQVFLCEVRCGPDPEDFCFTAMYMNENNGNPTAKVDFIKHLRGEVNNAHFKQGDKFFWDGDFFDSFKEVADEIESDLR